MAITKILNIQESEGRNPASHLKNALEYIQNPDKTEECILVGGINCLPDKMCIRDRSKCFVNWQKQLIWCRVMKYLKWLINRAFQREHWKMQRKNWASRQRKSITRGIGNWMQ